MQNGAAEIKAAGLQVVGVSYDSQETLKGFAEKSGVEFALLSDTESKVIKQFGLFDKGTREGSKKFGISLPMTVFVGQDGVVKGTVPGTAHKRHNVEVMTTAWAKVKGDAPAADKAENALSFTVKNIEGEDVELSKYLGKVVVIVNVASRCGYTPQYKTLQKLYADHSDDGLVILGFPCNQFRGQEPGTNEEIQEFCKAKYGVEFDMFSKLDVNGDNQDPLFKHLTSVDAKPKGSGKVKWNFEKFVIDREGKLAGRFGTKVDPGSDEFKEYVSGLLKQTMEKK